MAGARYVAICAGMLTLQLCLGCDSEDPGPAWDGAPCGPANCQGCCQGGMCVYPTNDSQCGMMGMLCSPCPQGQSCVNGSCGSGGCGPASCPSGCCQNDQCQGGLANNACGSGGGFCVDCTLSGQTCNPATTSCQGGGGCSPSTCASGCCQNNQCLGGKANNACGSGGTACVDCTLSGGTCNAATGSCQGGSSCGPSTCASGCCQNNQCLGGKADNACGTGGAACQNCAQSGGTCDPSTSSCTGGGPCGPSNCQGCCSFGQCLKGDTIQACGEKGVPCVACTMSIQACTSGKCEIDPNSNWAVGVIMATILQTTTWDPLVPGGTEPDPYVGKSDTCSKWSVNPCTKAIDNTFNPVWNQTLGVFKASDLKSGWCVYIGDADSVFGTCCTACTFNTIGMCKAQITDLDLIKGVKSYSVCPNPDDSQNYMIGLSLQFQYIP